MASKPIIIYAKEGGERLFFRVRKARVLWCEASLVLRVDGDLRMSMADLEGESCVGIGHLIAPQTKEVAAAAELEGTKNDIIP